MHKNADRRAHLVYCQALLSAVRVECVSYSLAQHLSEFLIFSIGPNFAGVLFFFEISGWCTTSVYNVFSFLLCSVKICYACGNLAWNFISAL